MESWTENTVRSVAPTSGRNSRFVIKKKTTNNNQSICSWVLISKIFENVRQQIWLNTPSVQLVSSLVVSDAPWPCGLLESIVIFDVYLLILSEEKMLSVVA